MRASEGAIMVGTQTALHDDPSLTARHWPGKNPVRIIIDKQLSLPAAAKIFSADAPTIVLNFLKEERKGNMYFYRLSQKDNLPGALMQLLYAEGINSLIVEGGATLLQSFIGQNLWDEATVISNTILNVGQGIAAPHLPKEKIVHRQDILADRLSVYKNQQNII
jgi:diaminohydroxyphosphoribosylaminopyrimidine deaminase/5-amino-6-(5-phosphoribosylamino)uracil reductase